MQLYRKDKKAEKEFYASVKDVKPKVFCNFNFTFIAKINFYFKT